MSDRADYMFNSEGCVCRVIFPDKGDNINKLLFTAKKDDASFLRTEMSAVLSSLKTCRHCRQKHKKTSVSSYFHKLQSGTVS